MSTEPENVKVGETGAQPVASENVVVGRGARAAKASRRPFQKRNRQLEQDIEHITEEMYRRNKELAETNKTLSLLRAIDALVIESHASLKLAAERITEAIVEIADYPFVGLLTRTTHSANELVLNGWSAAGWLGKLDPRLGFSRPLHVKLTHPWFSQIQGTTMVGLEDVLDEHLASFLGCAVRDVGRFRELVPLKSLYVVKLRARRQVVGLLIVGYMQPTTELPQADTELMDRLSESIGVALDNKLLFEENQHVLRQLKESNTKLRTLDEAKDDFISMASHQLRTPLTSIKGYTSLVLEGDAGKISPMQEKLLKQSFVSAQRMVYLIADLLNVSRLRTGKFIIDATPVNLAEIVTQELAQLKDTADSRELKLEYHKPKHFPEILLDETKIRQVIMNFVDNAIYYTPSGGRITIELLDKSTSIEFRVTDEGIGVPKSEQPHLFTKFYRAANARKARPDGTGLGLFMAKKVIIAQGGSLIFQSQENHGSTFGFLFSKTP